MLSPAASTRAQSGQPDSDSASRRSKQWRIWRGSAEETLAVEKSAGPAPLLTSFPGTCISACSIEACTHGPATLRLPYRSL